MKRKTQFIIGCAIARALAALWGLTRLSHLFFGDPVETICSGRMVDSIQLGERSTTVSVEEGVCDAGLVVSGAYSVVLRYRDHDNSAKEHARRAWPFRGRRDTVYV
jgi:hypothetical protein